MAYIETISPEDATGTVQDLYKQEGELFGFIPNYLQLFSHRPEVYLAWEALIASVRDNMSLRRYELVTLAAARALGGTYCMLAHGDNFLNSGEIDAAQLAAIAVDYHSAGLTPDEVAMMAFAEQIICQSGSVTQADVDGLKNLGFSDAEILDITLAATARSFFSKTLDALNAEPDAVYMGLDTPLRDALAVGRPFGG